MFGSKKLEAIESRLQNIEYELEIINSYVRKIESILSNSSSTYEKMRREFYSKLDELKKKNDSDC